MRKWWQGLSLEAKVVILGPIFLLVMIFWWYLFISYSLDLWNNIIFDSAKQEIKQELSFTEWVYNRLGPEDRYVLIPKKIELVNIEMNIAYKAEFQMPIDKTAIQKYLYESSTNDQIQKDLAEGIGLCISGLGRQGLQVKGYPLMIIRGISIQNMGELCPLNNNHGYQWKGSFELVQCHGDLPLDNACENECLNSVKFAHYP